jgi:N-methylhydantoinase B
MNLFIIPAAGPGMFGHDGWLTAGTSTTGGGMFTDSVELDELRTPILFDKNELAIDSGGSGQWDGAPAADVVFGSRKDPGIYAWVVDEKIYPAKGVLGGLSGRRADVYKISIESGKREDLPTMAAMTLTPDERLVSEAPGGPGYGDPLDRDPEVVKWRVREGWISLQRAKDVYGVVLNTSNEQYTVNCEETGKLRAQLRKESNRI